MQLCSHIPEEADLCDYDSFDLAFLSLTGHIKFADVSDLLFSLATSRAESVAFWGPETALTALAFKSAWKAVGGEKFTKDLISAFDLKGDISVDSVTIERLFKRERDVARRMWPLAEEKVLHALAATQERAGLHFERQSLRLLAKKGKRERGAWDDYVRDAMQDHVGTFTKSYPERVLHPEVQRLVRITEKDPNARLIDKAELTNRINKIAGMPQDYFTNASDVHVGRVWVFTGLQAAHEQSVSEYMYVAQHDKRLCPVCRRLDGKTFSVQQAHERMTKYLAKYKPPPMAATAPVVKPSTRPLRYAYKPQKGPGDASRELKKTFNIKSLTSSGYKVTPAGAEAVTKDTNYLGAEMSRMFNKYPKLADMHQKAPALDRLAMYNSKYVSTKKKLIGGYDLSRDRILLGMAAPRAEGLTIGPKWFSVGEDAATNFRHEYGHRVLDKAPEKIERQWLTTSLGLSKERRLISSYANQDHHEAFAEAFSAYTSPLYGQGPRLHLPEKIEKFFDEFIGG